MWLSAPERSLLGGDSGQEDQGVQHGVKDRPPILGERGQMDRQDDLTLYDKVTVSLWARSYRQLTSSPCWEGG